MSVYGYVKYRFVMQLSAVSGKLSSDNFGKSLGDPGIDARGYFGKRLVDVFLVILALLAIWPLLACIAASIWLRDGGPVIYRHTRIGRGGRPFQCLKFRTMVRDSDVRLAELLENDPAAREEWAVAQKLRNDPRVIPRIGQLLRATSLDELPQLLNVLRGDMSLVGPRPVTRGELDNYGEHVVAYLAMRPGLTGPWQISGRSDTTYSERVRLDACYAARNSIFRDLWIMLTTVPVVIARRGAYGLLGPLCAHATTLALAANDPTWWT